MEMNGVTRMNGVTGMNGVTEMNKSSMNERPREYGPNHCTNYNNSFSSLVSLDSSSSTSDLASSQASSESLRR